VSGWTRATASISRSQGPRQHRFRDDTTAQPKDLTALLISGEGTRRTRRTTNVKVTRFAPIATLVALALATESTPAAEPGKEGVPTFEFHGFVVGSLYTQDQTFLTGQGSGILIAAPTPAATLPMPSSTTSKSDTFLGGDVRQTRLILVYNGVEAWGARPKAHLEFDLFGNPNSGALGYESANIRLRQAFGELKWGNTTFDAGQHSAQILLAQIPASVAHITNPVPYGAGLLGWRSIGFRAFHAIPLDGAKVELGAEVSHGKWADASGATVFPGNAPNQISLAWAAKTPQLVARVKADGKSGRLSWMGWVAGSYESVNLKGFGNTVAPNGVTLQDGSVKKSLASYAATAGGNLTFTPVTLMFQAYTGRGTGPLAGTMLQFGDIGDIGYWAQLGVFATKQISIWGIYGGSNADKKDLQNWLNPTGVALTEANTTLRKDNTMYGGMVRFADGGYAVALEGYSYTTKYLLGNLANDGGTKSTDAYQILLSGGYFF
jgi:hypothetical protein